MCMCMSVTGSEGSFMFPSVSYEYSYSYSLFVIRSQRRRISPANAVKFDMPHELHKRIQRGNRYALSAWNR